jgi:hypothetical protein
MKEPNEEASSAGPTPVASGAKRAEKVRSSRYEWEDGPGEKDNPVPQTKIARGTLMRSLGAWFKKVFFWNRDFFDKDDDATPSAA